jgi:hypothetical protein
MAAMPEQPDLTRDYPCSWDQNERLTSASVRKAEQPEPNRREYAVAKAWRVKDASRLRDIARAWRVIALRHLSLRVAFRQYRPGYWVQRVLPCEAVESWFTVLDDATDEQLAELRSQVGLQTGQLFSVALVRRPVGLEIHFTFEHMCVDSLSLGVIIEEWSRLIDDPRHLPDEADDGFLKFCLDNAPAPESLEQKRDEWARAPANTFAPYALAPLTLSRGDYAVESTTIRLPWRGFHFDARACAAGIGPVLLAGGLDRLHGTQPGLCRDYPVIAELTGRSSREYERAVGPFYSWFMLQVPVGADDLATKARKVYGRLLNALRRPPTSFALETAIRVPELVGARNRPYDRTPSYLYANHLRPVPPFIVGGEVAEPIAVNGRTDCSGARVSSRSLQDGLELEFIARSDLLSPGVTKYLAAHAREQLQSEPALANG